MTRDELKKLRIHYHALKGQEGVLNQAKAVTVDRLTANILQAALDTLEADFPKLVPKFSVQGANSGENYFTLRPLRAHLATVLGTLEVHIADEPRPVVESLLFPFVHESKLREIVERDYVELQRAFVAQCWKSVIILSGGAMEAILTDLLLDRESDAKAAPSAPNKSDITKWDFADLINVAVKLEMINPGVSKLSHPIREYRNLVHPGNELRNNLKFGPEEARIAIEVLNMLHRDLSP